MVKHQSFRTLADFETWLASTVQCGAYSDLYSVLLDRHARQYQRVMIAAALGHMAETDPAVLREALNGSRSRDLVCASLLALARVAGSDVTLDAEPFLESRAEGERHYAFLIEGFVGDIRIKDRIMLEWSKIVRAPRLRQPASMPHVLRYLARHFMELTEEERSQVLANGARVWERAHPGSRHWLETKWPGLLVADDTGSRLPRPELISESLHEHVAGR